MLKLDLTFHLDEYPHPVHFGDSCISLQHPENRNVMLDGLSISIETKGRTYQVISERPPEPDRPYLSGGAIWPFCLLPLPDGVSVEQQMMLPVAGNAAAFSWRLRGRALAPVTLRVSPVFSVTPLVSSSFEIEPETNGGRLAWRASRSSSRIIADSNGRFVKQSELLRNGAIPATFEFTLGPTPALLIFSSETRVGAELNPLIGGFLAQLTEGDAKRGNFIPQDHLVAA
jgi:hypothetical protein